MEPAIGASTWAFGSQRWTPYRGILTKKAIRQAVHQNLLAHEWGQVEFGYCKISIDRVPRSFCRASKAISRGKEPARV